MRIAFLRLFRPVFVLFFLYLIGDALYRWDGFKHYGSFFEFLTSFSLASLLWTVVSVFAALLIWLPGRLIEWFFFRKKMSPVPELMFFYIFIFVSVIVLSIKLMGLPMMVVSSAVKLAVLVIIAFVSAIAAWIFSNRPWDINGRITPLVWLFGLWVMLSVPLSVYQFLEKQNTGAGIQNSRFFNMTHKDRPNIMLITFDAMMTEDMSVYGYHRPTTPFIDEWAKSSSLFTKLEAESTFTTPTAASLMTGKRLWTHLTYHYKGSKPVRHYDENLPALLKENGYYNMAIIVNEAAAVNLLGMDHDFDFAPLSSEFMLHDSLTGEINRVLHRLFSDKFRIYDWIIKDDFVFMRFVTYFSRKALKTSTPAFIAFERFLLNLDVHGEEPFFAWIHLNPPHDPYLPPEPYIGMFNASTELRTKQSQNKLVEGQGKIVVTEEMQPAVDILRARYDEFIRYCDKQFEGFILELSERGLLKNTVIILSSDHGESFEHNVLGHGSLHLYEQLTNIPLIIRMPDVSEGKRIDNVVEQIDIPATILDLANLQVPDWMEGKSLVPLMYGESSLITPAFSMSLFIDVVGQPISKGTVSVWESDYKLIYYLKDNKSLLFNLKQDPGEQVNLFESEPEKGEYLLNLVKTNVERANKRMKMADKAETGM